MKIDFSLTTTIDMYYRKNHLIESVSFDLKISEFPKLMNMDLMTEQEIMDTLQKEATFG
jgi:hypothetical protein